MSLDTLRYSLLHEKVNYITSNINILMEKNNTSTSTFSGSYTDLLNKPTIPSISGLAPLPVGHAGVSGIEDYYLASSDDTGTATKWVAPAPTKVYGHSYLATDSSATVADNEDIFFNRLGNSWTTDFNVGCTFTNGVITFSRTGYYQVNVGWRINARPQSGGTPQIIFQVYKNTNTFKNWYWQGGTPTESSTEGIDRLANATFDTSFIINIENVNDYLNFGAHCDTTPAQLIAGVKSTYVSVHNVD